MDIAQGFQIEAPSVFVPWSVSQQQLRQLVPDMYTVTRGYLVLRGCVSLNGLKHDLGFHFDPLDADRLIELEFFSFAFPDLQTSYATFQRHLEKTFGPPGQVRAGDNGFPHCVWTKPPMIQIMHFIYERFGPEEHVRIKKYTT